MRFTTLARTASALLTALLAVSCVSVNIPKDYVPDDKVVFLMQDTGFGPIRYGALAADPYVFQPDSTPVDGTKPAFLKSVSLERLLKADFKADSRLYREAFAHFNYVLKLPLFEELRPILDKADIKPPAPLLPNKGDKIQDFTNGTEYVYPDAVGARITVLNSGVYLVTFSDKSVFQWQPDGVYFWKDAQGVDTQQYNLKLGYIMVKIGDYTFEKDPMFRRLKSSKGVLEFDAAPQAQYNLTPSEAGAAQYTFFLDKTSGVYSCSVKTASGLRFDWFPMQKSLLVTKGTQAVSIDASFQKIHALFDTVAGKASDVLSVYLPQGIRLANLDAKDLGYAEVNPAWPEGYKVKTIGPFDVWYTAKDEALLGKIRSDRLTTIEAQDHALSGLSGVKRRAIIIPPDLNAYRKLHASKPGEVLNWYPSGFESLDYITMWLLSVPRYDKPAGQDYFLTRNSTK